MKRRTVFVMIPVNEQCSREGAGTKHLVYHACVILVEFDTDIDIPTVPREIKTRWTKHYTDLLNIPTERNEEEENQLQRPIAANTNDEITTLEVEAVIERSRNCKATRTDCIPNEIYKAGSVGTLKALTMIFNTSYRTGKIPQEWGRSVTCPIYKNKGDFLKCENYRGISLLNYAFKI